MAVGAIPERTPSIPRVQKLGTSVVSASMHLNRGGWGMAWQLGLEGVRRGQMGAATEMTAVRNHCFCEIFRDLQLLVCDEIPSL